MMYVMVRKHFREEEKRFWSCRERVLVMPVSEKLIVCVKGVFQKDT